MQVTSTQQNSKTKRHNFVELSRYLNNSKGFTLVELLISIAIIGILAAVGIPQYTQYKVRAYDAHSKQALKDMHLLCNAYWLDTDSEQGCDLPIIKDATYGFNQNTDVVATLPPSPLDNFCASAKHNSSPNTYSIDSAAMISDNADCGTGRVDQERAAQAIKIKEDAERGYQLSDIDKRQEQRCAYAISTAGYTEMQCRQTWGYKATGTFEEEIKRPWRGNYIDYNKTSALGRCRCNNGFRIPRLNNPPDAKFCSPSWCNPGLRAVPRPCEENLPTIDECMAGEGLEMLMPSLPHPRYPLTREYAIYALECRQKRSPKAGSCKSLFPYIYRKVDY